MNALQIVYLVRHGETEWSSSHQHTGSTDIALTPAGETEAESVGKALVGLTPTLALSSPLQRAARTAELAGFGATLQTDDDLVEWDYGAYEGLTSAEIHAQRPDWLLFRDGCPDGESPAQVSRRADRVVARLRAAEGTALIFSHGHFSRVLAARWLGLPVEFGRYFLLSTSAISVLGYEHGLDEPAIVRWNDTGHLH